MYNEATWDYYNDISLVYIDRMHADALTTKVVIIFDGADFLWDDAAAPQVFAGYKATGCVWDGAAKNHWEWVAYFADAAQADCTTGG
jgi:hypothetical protein